VGDKTRGIYEKFRIERTDGKHLPGEKHDGCEYFVLDLTHDPHAIPALAAYAASCREEYPLLAADLMKNPGVAEVRLVPAQPEMTPEEIDSVLERYDQTEPKLQRQIVAGLLCRLAEALAAAEVPPEVVEAAEKLQSMDADGASASLNDVPALIDAGIVLSRHILSLRDSKGT
jgi:hypothetical protein